MPADFSMPILVVDDYQTMVRIIRKRAGGARDDPGEALWTGHLRLEHGADDRLRALLQKVRSDPAHRDVPFIMVTAESKTDNVVAARKAGVNNYIVKPFNAAMLKAKIETVFSAAAA